VSDPPTSQSLFHYITVGISLQIMASFPPPPAVASFYHTTLRCPHHGHITARNHNATRRAGKSMASRAHIRWVSGPTSQTRPNRQHATPASNGCMPSSRDGPHMVSIDLDGTEDLPDKKIARIESNGAREQEENQRNDRHVPKIKHRRHEFCDLQLREKIENGVDEHVGR